MKFSLDFYEFLEESQKAAVLAMTQQLLEKSPSLFISTLLAVGLLSLLKKNVNIPSERTEQYI